MSEPSPEAVAKAREIVGAWVASTGQTVVREWLWDEERNGLLRLVALALAEQARAKDAEIARLTVLLDDKQEQVFTQARAIVDIERATWEKAANRCVEAILHTVAPEVALVLRELARQFRAAAPEVPRAAQERADG